MYIILIIVCMFVVFVGNLEKEKHLKKNLNIQLFLFQKKIIILICLAVIIVILGSMVAGWLGLKR